MAPGTCVCLRERVCMCGYSEVHCHSSEMKILFWVLVLDLVCCVLSVCTVHIEQV